MTINFYCPVCNAPIRGVPDSAACQQGVCRSCGSTIRVPAARRVSDDDIVALLGPVPPDTQPLTDGFETATDQPIHELELRGEPPVATAANPDDDAGEAAEISVWQRLVTRVRESSHRLLLRLQRFHPQAIRRRFRWRSLLRKAERFVIESDQMALTSQRLLSLTTGESLERKDIVSVFASDGRTKCSLTVHSPDERYVYSSLEPEFARAVVEIIRSGLSITPGVPTLPAAARESSDLFDLVFGQAASPEPTPASLPTSSGSSFRIRANPSMTMQEHTTSRPQKSGRSSERTGQTAMARLRSRGYRPESLLDSRQIMRAMRNCDVAGLARMIDDPENTPLRFSALAAIRDLGPQASAALPALQRLIDSAEPRNARDAASQDHLRLLTAVSETYLAVSRAR